MKLVVMKEKLLGETRVACNPEMTQKYIQMGFDVWVEAGAGELSSFSDDAFAKMGAKIVADRHELLFAADVILKVQKPTMAEIDEFSAGSSIVAHLSARTDRDLVQALANKKIRAFAMDLLPRISRAQSMDILSSQANLAGYKAVLDACGHYPRALPMMMTAAGTIPPAKVLIMGVGVAGLQAIATAKRLGAVVMATDVRPATKEQVESLGGKFIAVEDEEFKNAQTAGGYAKEMSDAYKAKQAALIGETIAKCDIIITTALIPGRPAPKLLSSEMVQSMKEGSVILDMAVETGGNCALSECGKVVKKHGVTIIGYDNYPARIPNSASNLLAKNYYNFLSLITDKNTKQLVVNTDDEIVKGCLIADNGNIMQPELI